MTRGFAGRQRGAALLLMLAIVALSGSWYLVSRLNADSGSRSAVTRVRNAEVLNRAKQALIGYVAMKAAQTTENEPGALPCPEPAGNAGGANEGIAAGNLSLPAVGRLPWKTLGIDRLVDASAEPLWYVVANSWGKCSTTNTVINSNCTSPGSGMTCWSGQLTVDGQANAAVALIIAPGPAMNVAASTGCTMRNQARSAPSPSIDALNYLECYSTATSTFSTTGPSASFNNQVVKITAAEILPAIEAAIAHRIERQIVPILNAVYTGAKWGFPISNPVYPFPAPFDDPSASAMQGELALGKGLLPLSYAETTPMSGTPCTPGDPTPRCSPIFVAWTGTPTMSGTSIHGSDCTGTTATQITCTYYYRRPHDYTAVSSTFTVNATALNVGMAMRQLNRDVNITNVAAADRSVSAVLGSSGSAATTFSGTITRSDSGFRVPDQLCGLDPPGLGSPLVSLFGCMQNSISIPILLFADHSFLESTSTGAGATGWFLRNRWHELTYYAVAAGHMPAVLPSAPACTTGTSCLNVQNVTPSGGQRAILILAGRSINGSGRPSSAIGDYLEFGNAGSFFERQPVSTAVDAALKKPFNDRIVVIGSN